MPNIRHVCQLKDLTPLGVHASDWLTDKTGTRLQLIGCWQGNQFKALDHRHQNQGLRDRRKGGKSSGEKTKRTHSSSAVDTGHFPPGTFLNGTNVDSLGAAEQGMALSRLLLLCMVASKVWDAETNPIDFVCNKGARRAMNVVAGLESALSGDCNGSTNLSTPVQLPCTELHMGSWGNKSHQEKRRDIVASLRLLLQGVNVLKAPSQPGCAASLLQRLKKNINNYLLILTHLQLSQGPVVSPALSCVPRSTQSLSTVLLNYNKLISGKLERFMVNLGDRCISQ
ncbi:LOW QUALITY PROTEIN: thrombopoietin [Anarhichas minor]|uniref:LOW QUALITY PROTEIN: thrombopoietin n=1 Tax=Anarhichas minor TaxID=65739 RepID=UPI003F7404A0